MPQRYYVGDDVFALEPDELLTDVEIPAPAPGSGWAFGEVSRPSVNAWITRSGTFHSAASPISSADAR